MKVTVTAENIENGTPRRAYCCPIALAIMSGHPNLRGGVEVLGPKTLLCDGSGNPYEEAELPPVALEFIGRFDNGDPVTPIEFELTWAEVSGP